MKATELHVSDLLGAPAWLGGAEGEGEGVEKHTPDGQWVSGGLQWWEGLSHPSMRFPRSRSSYDAIENTPIFWSVLCDPGLLREDTWPVDTSDMDRHRCSLGTNHNLRSATSNGEMGQDQRLVQYTKYRYSFQHTENPSRLFKNCLISS